MLRDLSVEFFIEASTILETIERSRAGGRILDAGCGRGVLGCYLVLAGYMVQGMDIDCSESMIPCVEHDAAKAPWPFEDKSFDVVVSQHMIEHIPYSHQLTAVKEMLRVAKHLVVIVTPNKKFKWKPTDGPYNPEHIGLHDANTLYSLLRRACPECRIEVREVQSFAYASGKYFPHVKWLVEKLPKPTLIGVINLD